MKHRQKFLRARCHVLLGDSRTMIIPSDLGRIQHVLAGDVVSPQFRGAVTAATGELDSGAS